MKEKQKLRVKRKLCVKLSEIIKLRPCVVGIQMNCLNEMFHLSNRNIWFG